MLKKGKGFAALLALVFALQSILMPAVYAEESYDVVMEMSVPQLTLTNFGNTSDSMELYWTSTDNSIKASTYDVYRDNSLIKTVEGFTYTDSGLSPQTKYTYAVKAKNENGEVIAESNLLSVTTSSEAVIPETAEKLTDAAISIEQPEAAKDDGEILKVGNPDFKTDRFIIKYKNEDVKKSARKVLEKIDNKNNIFDKDFKKLLKGSKQNNGIKAFTDSLKSSEYVSADAENSGEVEIVPLNQDKTLEEFSTVLENNNMADSIEYIQPDYQLSLSSNDPYYGSQWGLENISVENNNINSMTMEDRIDRLPIHLIKSVDRSPELRKFLLNTPIEEVKDKLIEMDVPGNIEPQILNELAFQPCITDTEYMKKSIENQNNSYLCDARVSEAWEKSTGNGALIAVIDTGVEVTHEDIAENIWVNSEEIPGNGIDDEGNGKVDDINGWNFTNNSNLIFDTSNISNENHGTHISGILAAVSGNGKGIAGVAPAAKIMPLKVFTNGKAYTSDIISAIQYAEDMGVKIVNCSWGSTDGNPALRETILNSNMLFVCAAGNNSVNIDSTPIYPAAFDCSNIITVASVNKNGTLSGFSNYGENSVDVAAPGEGIKSALTDDSYGDMSGTSMAAAFVSGEAALLLSSTSGSSIELKERIIQCSEHLSSLTGKVSAGSKINCVNSLNNNSTDEIINVPSTAQGSAADMVNMEKSSLFSTSAADGQYIKISAGTYHTLALRDDGTVWACGKNDYGQLGVNSTTDINSPVQISGLNGITSISAGNYHSIALRNDGTVWTWGNNYYGQLGNKTTVSMFSPVQVSGLSGIIAIAGGQNHSLALKNDGTVWAWGYNSYGQLGDGTTTNRSIPTQVSGLTGITAIACGYHSLALKNDGTVWAWGNNSYGQLGDGTTKNRNIPTQVTGLNGITAIACGYHSLALKNDGTVWTWGNNYYGQLGDGTTTNRTTAVQVKGLSGIKAVACGNMQSLVLKSNGTVWAWGFNYYGQLGDGTRTDSSIAILVSGLDGSAAISSGAYHSLAIKKDGTVWAWGDNGYGQLGNGIVTKRAAPVMTKGMNGITAIATGGYHGLELTYDGKVLAWGDNEDGQLGDGTTIDRTLPIRVSNLSGITAIACGKMHSLALKNDGTVWAWGDNSSGQLGDGTTTDRATAVQVTGLSGIVSIACGDYYNIVTKNNGTIWAWGANSCFQLGDGTNTIRTTAVQATDLYGIWGIVCGKENNLGLSRFGESYQTYAGASGSNSFGELGFGTFRISASSEPLQVKELSNVVAVASGGSNCLALQDDGTVWEWGLVEIGNSSDSKCLAEPVSGLSEIVSISRGMALKNDGTVWTWGKNEYGELGNGTTIPSTSVGQVSGLSNVTAVSSGDRNRMTLVSDGIVWAWGDNYFGQLGNGEKGYCEYAKYSFGTPYYTPILTISSPQQNQVFTNTISVSGTVNDQNIGDVLTIKYKIGNGAEQKLSNTIISNGTAKAFSIANIDISTLANGNYSLSVWAIDDKGSVSVVQSIAFTKEFSITKTVSCTEGKTFNLVLKLKNMKNISGKTFTITYDPSNIPVVTDLCKLTYKKETTTGIVAGTGITILKNVQGTIVFSIDKSIPENKSWSGVANIIEFKPAHSGPVTFTCKVE